VRLHVARPSRVDRANSTATRLHDTTNETAHAEDRLRDLRSVTDATLGRLDVDELLAELLRRTQEILDADTAVVLMVDTASRHLVARVARGLEEEVRQGVHIPLGTGFAGRIAAHGQPIVLDRVDATTVANPILWEKGVRTMLGVPLLVGRRVIGVLHVGRIEDRPFTPADVELLEVVADRVVGAVERRQAAVEHAAAGLLERSLLPAALPVCEGLQFATRYITPDDRSVGGDWYDAFTVPSGDLWLVVGDVAGHGLGAAVVMGRVRSALRAYSLIASTPETVLELTDRKVEHFEIDMMVTVVCAVASPPFDRFRIATAGHPPPVIVAPGQGAHLVQAPVGPPLGALSSGERTSVELELPRGAAMVLYTDGLIERRGEHIAESLGRLLASAIADEPERVCRAILRDLVGADAPTDDIAIVVAQRTP
jgi:sigma-B regulation protein RsbU (phosphoserine phosphatase)